MKKFGMFVAALISIITVWALMAKGGTRCNGLAELQARDVATQRVITFAKNRGLDTRFAMTSMEADAGDALAHIFYFTFDSGCIVAISVNRCGQTDAGGTNGKCQPK